MERYKKLPILPDYEEPLARILYSLEQTRETTSMAILLILLLQHMARLGRSEADAVV